MLESPGSGTHGKRSLEVMRNRRVALKRAAVALVGFALVALGPVSSADAKDELREGSERERPAPQWRKPVAHVEVKCRPRVVDPPCFERIQDAIDALVDRFPDERRVVRIGVGRYEQQFSALHPKGSTHIIGEFPVPAILSEEAPVVIAAPPNGVADVNWRFAGPGSLSAVTFFADPLEDGDVGLRFDGIWVTEMNVVDVGIVFTLGAGSHAIDIAQQVGFIQFYDVRALGLCSDGISDADSAVLYLDMPPGPFHQFHWFGGELQSWGALHPVKGCATLEAKRSTIGDDTAYTVFERLHMQAEGASTMIEVDSKGVRLDFANNHYRAAPIGKFVEVKGTSGESRVRFQGETRARAVEPSVWGNVVPEGVMTIFGEGDPAGVACFPGRWTYYRHDGPPDIYDCTDFDVWSPR
jgi:hypothetical protein